MNTKIIAWALSLLALLPFTLKWWPSIPTFLLEINSTHVLMSYSAVVLAFLAGSHWALGIKHGQNKLLFLGIIVALAAWCLLWVDTIKLENKTDLSWALMAILFLVQGSIEVFFPKGFWPNWYQVMRAMLSVAVTALLLLRYV